MCWAEAIQRMERRRARQRQCKERNRKRQGKGDQEGKEEVRRGHCKERKGKGQGNAMDVDEGVEEKRRREKEIRAVRGGFYGRDCELSWHVPSRMVINYHKEKAWHVCLIGSSIE